MVQSVQKMSLLRYVGTRCGSKKHPYVKGSIMHNCKVLWKHVGNKVICAWSWLQSRTLFLLSPRGCSILSSGGDAVKTISIAFSLSKELALEKFEASSFLENNRLLQVSSTCQISVLKSLYHISIIWYSI